jgi:Fe-S-cluster containining protein
MNSERVELDSKKRKLIFHGSCLELRPMCVAMCCREWILPVSYDEHRSGLIQSDTFCALTEKICDKPVDKCAQQIFRLKKNAEGVCVHLDDASNQCRIYENRPQVCRDFFCQGGWRLNSVFPVGGISKPAAPELERETFAERLSEDEVFVSHPLIKLHAVFCLPSKGEIVFIKQMVGACGKFNSRDSFPFPQLNDELVLALIHSFNSQDTLKVVRQCFCAQHALNLTTGEFKDIVWLFNKHNLILSIKNFHGMLAGMGGIEY